MERSNRKSNRKPLSDCTNTHQNHLQSSKLIAKKTLTLINKPPRKPPNLPPNSINTTNLKNNQSPNFNLNASTGSNNSPVSDIVPSRPVTPISRAGDKVCRKSGHSATLPQRQDEQTRKDKGKSVGKTPVVQESTYLTPRAVENQISSSAVSGDGGDVTIPRAVETHEEDERIRKGKGKMGVETPIIHMSVGITSPVQRSTYSTSQGVHISSSAISGDGGYVSRPRAVENREIDEQIRKDKGKMVVETPIIHVSSPLTSDTLPTSSSAASGDFHLSGDGGYVSRPRAAENREIDEQIRKDKGKMVVETPIIHVSSPLTSDTLPTSSSAASDDFPLPGPSEMDEQRRKDKGKMVVETPIIHISSPLTSHTLQTSSSAASGNSYLPRPSAVHIHEKDTPAKKADRKTNQESHNLQASDPVTPRFLRSSSSAASGTDSQQKTGLIVYNQRRTSKRKKAAVGPISLPFSCPPGKRTRKNGMELDGRGGDGYSGSLTDPLPLQKKKRSYNKKNESMHAMSEEEVKKLRKYFDEIDSFDLEEEVASESELE